MLMLESEGRGSGDGERADIGTSQLGSGGNGEHYAPPPPPPRQKGSHVCSHFHVFIYLFFKNSNCPIGHVDFYALLKFLLNSFIECV